MAIHQHQIAAKLIPSRRYPLISLDGIEGADAWIARSQLASQRNECDTIKGLFPSF